MKFGLWGIEEDLFRYHNIAVNILSSANGVDLAIGVVFADVSADGIGFFLGGINAREKEKKGVIVKTE